MCDKNGFVDYLLELLGDFGPVNAQRMFGGHGIFRDGLMFALVADNTLYLKVDDENRPKFESLGLVPFVYHKKDRPVSLSYYRAPEQALDNSEEMREWALSAFEAALRGRSSKG